MPFSSMTVLSGAGSVCGADEAGRAAWAGPLVTAAVRFDYSIA